MVLTAIGALVGSLLNPSTPLAASFTVPTIGTITSIGQAIGLCADGDTVLVSPGIYLENIEILDKKVVLSALAVPSETILDGGNANTTVIRLERAGASVVRGFTIRNGRSYQGAGGGIYLVDCSPNIEGNIFEHNSAGFGTGQLIGYGGAIAAYSTVVMNSIAPRIASNAFYENRTTLVGGAVYGSKNVDFSITDNIFEGNIVTEGDGGAIGGIVYSSTSVVSNNRFSHNAARDHGGAIYLGTSFTSPSSSVRIDHNLFVENIGQAAGNTGTCGSAIWSGMHVATIEHNTIVGGIAGGSNPDAIAIEGGSSVTVRNCIVSFNSGKALSLVASGTASILNNVFWKNSLELPNEWGAVANFYFDPLFCAAEPNYYGLAMNSPVFTQVQGGAGAFATASCTDATSIVSTTWSRIKASLGNR